jgi:2-keto-4-pentenoate hydratase/2-oxohepta-3-ene-1,7-dioic acid hydratase in catechol pathway
MILLTYKTPNGLQLGIKTNQGVLDVAVAASALDLSEVALTPDDFYAGGNSALPPLADLLEATQKQGDATWFRDESSIKLGPCVPSPGKIICVGLNYLRHAQESGMAPPSTPVLFSKFSNSVAAPGGDIPLPSHAEAFDYEAELVVVIGKRAKNVSEGEALGHVLGYCNGNDISERNLQMLTGQWLLGKTLDKFMPLGPYTVTTDEAGNPNDMSVRLWFNGELRQHSNTSDLIFSVSEVISYASRYMTLEPGDVISTGTPEGVILGMDEKVWMKPGDETIVEVGKLGHLSNRMVAG